MQEQLCFVLGCLFKQVDQCQDPNSCQEQTVPLPHPQRPPPCSVLGTRRTEVLGGVSNDQQLNTFAKEKATPHLLSLAFSLRTAGLWTKRSWGHKPAYGPTQGTRISFHYKPRGRRCQLKSPKVKAQSQSTLRKSLSSLKFGKKEVLTPTFKHNILVCSPFFFFLRLHIDIFLPLAKL